MKKGIGTQLREYAIFVLPTCICLILVELMPFLNGLFYSMTDWNGISQEFNFIGLQNYINALSPGSEYFGYFKTAILFMLAIVPLSNILAILLANVLNVPKLRTRKFAQVLLFMPYVLSSVVVVFLWRFVFSNCFGVIGKELGIEILQAGWLSEKKLAFWSIVIVSVWSSVGYLTMIYTAGLQTIDQNLLEAAMIDGATAVQRFLYIKVPLLMGSVTICLFLSISGALNMFELPQLMTSGGPGGATTTPALSIYNTAYLTRKFGQSMAQSIILFVFVLLVTLIQMNITGKREQRM